MGNIIHAKDFLTRYGQASVSDRTELFLKTATDYAKLFHIDTAFQMLSDSVQASFFFGEVANLDDLKGLIVMADEISCVARPGGKGIVLTLEMNTRP